MRELLESIRDRHERVLVVGLGISGVETARLLLRLGIRPRCVELRAEAEFRKAGKHIAAIDQLQQAGSELLFGVALSDISQHLEAVRLCVLSPGVSLTQDVKLEFSRRGIEWCGELELGLRLFSGQVVTITGSNGKSTTATLTAKFLEDSGVSNVLCGNIGIPIVSALAKERSLIGSQAASVLVVEASSYQLADIRALRIHTHVILNLSENHLERHGSMESYRAAKASPLAAQSAGDVAILNADDAWLAPLAAEVCGELGVFGADSPQLDFATLAATVRYAPAEGIDELFVRRRDEVSRISTAGLSIIGRHNRMNVAAAALAASSLGGQFVEMAAALHDFMPLEHRLERVSSRAPGIVINDSKATTVAAVVAALRAVSEEYPTAPIWCLLGGRAKVGSWLPVVAVLKALVARIRSVVCFGEDGARIRATFAASGLPTTLAPTLEEAVRLIQVSQLEGEVMLFSPGCASFDAFRDFEERGAAFKALVST